MYPKVRFRGFDEPWKKVKLGRNVKRIRRKNKNLETNIPLTISAQFGLVDQRDFFGRVVASENLANYILLKRGEFAYNKSYSKEAPYGSIKRLEKYNEGALSTLYIAFTPENINSDFLKAFFDTTKWYSHIVQVSTEGARNHGLLNISPQDFFEMSITIPKSDEQNNISRIYNLMNSLLSLQQRKLELENKLKKQIAFYLYSFTLTPNFKHIEVKNKKLGDIVDISNGIMGDSQKKSGNFKLTRIETISNGKIDLSRTGYIDQVSDEKKFLEVGDILYSNINSLTHIGKNAIVKEKHLPLVHGINLFRLHITNNQITPNYLHGLLNLPKYKWWVKSHANPAVNQASINKTELSSLVIKYPDLDIQNQINNINYSFAQYWDIQYSKKESLCQLKQFLLQNLFI
ncbi:restriction endonuclease subunit S [Lactobacillus jensenii]|uniref:restriction endonuclease subunit S n=1 Tax=Lactobacillus jensenii TaxID=109790 RepID=UPI0012481246|nr:restriction endonuclease subunit S [Lactobacillus jensenii]KAA9264035.1 restriction endonuclease subunit S [Lactobacillus jensenii]MDX5076167.1 restriction endonuclease subunit S [Lactobacillus jensenii]MDX5112063.1 restriction endonuclease subunit S [Lactobacillus jensenii]NJJ09492.1 restriction endonuclease subunit S [Lactobacillus jensenii]